MLMGGLSAFHATAGIIDFSGLSNGTPVSEGNPYATSVYLQATTVQQVLAPGVLGPITTTQEALVQNGQAAVVPQFVAAGAMYRSSFTADFVQPVTDVSFDVGAYRHGGYIYTAVNGAGDTISGTGQTGTGGIELPDPHHITVTLPAGYALTRLEIGNSDPIPGDAAVWVDNLAFQPVSGSASVSDSGNSWVLLAGGLAGIACLGRFRAFSSKPA